MDKLKQFSRGGFVGYSSHDLGKNICEAAVARGAKIIEKHFTLDRTLKGIDHRVSLLPNEFLEMSNSIKEIELAVQIFDNALCPITLMHTVSTYPAQEKHLNLNCIKSLQTKFDKPIGYSGHEATVLPSIVAAVLGATCIERHITLDRAMYGSDQAASLQKNGLRDLVNSIRKSEIVLGDGEKTIIPEELEVAKKLRYWYQN